MALPQVPGSFAAEALKLANSDVLAAFVGDSPIWLDAPGWVARLLIRSQRANNRRRGDFTRVDQHRCCDAQLALALQGDAIFCLPGDLFVLRQESSPEFLEIQYAASDINSTSAPPTRYSNTCQYSGEPNGICASKHTQMLARGRQPSPSFAGPVSWGVGRHVAEAYCSAQGQPVTRGCEPVCVAQRLTTRDCWSLENTTRRAGLRE